MQAAYGEARPLAQWPISTQEVERQFLRVPMRKDHKSLQENKKDVVHQLADLLAKRNVTVDVAGNEKRNHLASLSNGQAGGISRGEPARFLSLTDGSMAPSASGEAELRSTDPVAKAASASADADPNKMLQIVAFPQDRRLADGEEQSQPTAGNAVVPAGHGCNNDAAGSYGDVAQQFLDARKSWKMGHSELPTIAEEKEESSSYESVTEEEGEPAREACPTREVEAAESREAPASSGRAPALRPEKRAACPAEEESSESRAPRHRRRGRSESSRRTKGRGKGKRPEKPRFRFCWKEVTLHESGQSQHEYWSVYCLSWQFKLAGYPYSQCDQLAEDLKQRRMDSFQQWGPVMEAHVAFPADEPSATAAPALAAHPAVPAPEAEARLVLPEPSHEDRRDPAPKKEKKHKEPRKESHKEKRKEKKHEKATKAAARDAVPEEKKKKKSKKDKGNKIHVIAVSPSPETMRRRKRDPPSSSESDGHSELPSSYG
eukprot:s891_g23.t1